MEKPDISIIIVSFNTKNLTLSCLDALVASSIGSFTMEIIICDNASHDGSAEAIRKKFPRISIIENKKNLGFAAGNNSGIKKARGRYILLLNSDTEVGKDTIRSMIEFMDQNPDAGAATCKLILPDGTMDPACHRGIPTPWVAFTYITRLEKLFPKTKLFGEYHQGYKNFSTVHEVDCISGAFFLVRQIIVNSIGLLDEDYFMYAEDIDWAYKIRKNGWKILFNPLVTTLHKKKQSGRASGLRERRIQSEIYFHRYNWLFYKKHFQKTYHPLVSLFVNITYTARLFFLERVGL